MLVRDTPTVREYFPQTTVDDFAIFRPHVVTAEEKYVIPYLGRPTYDRLNDYLNAIAADPSDSLFHSGYLFPDNYLYPDSFLKSPPDEPSPTAEQSVSGLLPLAQRAVVYFAYRVSVPIRNVADTPTGFAVTQNSTLAPASRDRTAALQEGVDEYGWNAIDVMLRYLEDHRDDFPEWYNSPVSTLAFRNLVNNATEFGQYVKLPAFSRIAFQSLRSVMDNVEMLIIAQKIGDDVFSDLKFKMKEGVLSSDDDKVIAHLKRALANLVMAENVPDPEFRVTSPYAVFNITDIARQKYHLVGMEYLNRAIKIHDQLSPSSPSSLTDYRWLNQPANKIFVGS